ncbi:MAG: hypothetical protein M3040_06610, partial [Bacteroidota bacterium]|nr:hypothetical protein [Bacteroidota bacterium]
VVYYNLKEKAHHFSFESSTKPSVNSIQAELKNDSDNTGKKETFLQADDNEDNPVLQAAPIPPAKTTRHHSVYIIRI